MLNYSNLSSIQGQSIDNNIKFALQMKKNCLVN